MKGYLDASAIITVGHKLAWKYANSVSFRMIAPLE